MSQLTLNTTQMVNNMDFIEWFKTLKEYRQLRWTLTEGQIFEHNGSEYSVMCVSTAHQAFEYLKSL
jgi:hypothetical protein